MAIRWNTQANRDLVRLHAFLDPVNPSAALEVVEHLVSAVERLAVNPRLGARLPGFERREVRRLIAGEYEVRYEVREREVVILRIWHVKEDR